MHQYSRGYGELQPRPARWWHQAQPDATGEVVRGQIGFRAWLRGEPDRVKHSAGLASPEPYRYEVLEDIDGLTGLLLGVLNLAFLRVGLALFRSIVHYLAAATTSHSDGSAPPRVCR